MDISFGRGPAAAGQSTATYEYFVAVTRKNIGVINKQTFPIQVTFPAGQDRVSRDAFTAMGYPAQIAGVQESTRGDAPFQCNGAMGAAGIAKKRGEKLNPRDIAAAAIDALKSHPLNLRSAVIGEAIKRLFRVQGHNVIGDVHMGDWGLQMGHLISELEIEQPDLPYFDAAKVDDYPKESPVTMDDLARLYPQASNAARTALSRRLWNDEW